MANFKTGWHGPSLVQNDNSDLKGNFSGIDRVPWKENTSSSSNSVKLTAAVEGTDNATAYDVDIASFAITDDLEGTDSTDYLRCTNFNFNIPPHATIRGVKVRFKCQSTGDDALETHDGRIYLVVDGSYINGDDGRDHADMAKAFSRYNMLFQQSLNIVIPINTNLRVCGIIKVVLPTVGPTQVGDSKPADNESSGYK